MAAEGIGVTELSLHLPSLDEVFLTLTGQRASTDIGSDISTDSSTDETEKKEAAA